MRIPFNCYSVIDNGTFPPGEDIFLIDHLTGFDSDIKNLLLDKLVNCKCNNIVYLQYVITPELKARYASIDIRFSAELQNSINFVKHAGYNIHPALDYKNFICSFNGSAHISRKFLVSLLHKFKYFNPDYCSKNFSYLSTNLSGHIQEYQGQNTQFYNKFFLDPSSENFFQTVNSFGHVRFDHARNIYNLEHKLTQSFLHIVSETMATSYYPFVTEKFLYSIVTRGLFLAYAQPGWHSHLDQYYGFKRYNKLFDYRFDSIQNPVERLVELMSMISKFSVLSTGDWRDLYLLEQDTIEYNYDHYFSGNYLKMLEKNEH
jgi:hypothetical protein